LKSKSTILAFFLLTVFFSSIQILPRARDISKYFSQADEEILSGEYDKAIANYLKGMMFTSWREEAEIFDDLGYAYLQKREYEKAKRYLIQSIGFHRENFNPRFYLAVIYILNNEIELAAEQLKIIEENVYFDQSWMAKTSGLDPQKPNGKIIKENELERIKNEKGIYLEKKSLSKTIIHLDAFDERNEGAFYFAQGVVYKINEEFDEAQRKFFEALEANYNEREVRLQLANLYLKQNKKDEAEEQLKKISSRVIPFPDLHPTKFDVHHRLKYHDNYIIADMHTTFLKELEKGKIDEAIKALEKAIGLKPSNPQPYLTMAKISIAKEEIEIAASYLNTYLYLGGKKDKEVYSLLNLIEKRKKINLFVGA